MRALSVSGWEAVGVTAGESHRQMGPCSMLALREAGGVETDSGLRVAVTLGVAGWIGGPTGKRRQDWIHAGRQGRIDALVSGS